MTDDIKHNEEHKTIIKHIVDNYVYYFETGENKGLIDNFNNRLNVSFNSFNNLKTDFEKNMIINQGSNIYGGVIDILIDELYNNFSYKDGLGKQKA